MHAGHVSQKPYPRHTNLETSVTSPPTSQASSLNISPDSQLSQVLPIAAGDLNLIHTCGVMTLSTSLLSESSHEGTDTPYLVESDAPPIDQDEIIDALFTSDSLDKDYTSAPKRMANGETKPSECSPPTSPVESSKYIHSRNSSRTSTASQIGEVGHFS